tara:strand:+ start:858 stop:1697 length:840 start_codon:yes stop_codon:yes gene_type:complete
MSVRPTGLILKIIWPLKTQRARAALGTLGFAVVLGGCATPAHVLPVVQPGNLNAAAAEIARTAEPSARAISDIDAVARVAALYQRLKPAAIAVCRYVGEHHCNWELTYSPEEDINAYASDDVTVVIYKGIVQYARSDAEIAMVIAHEMAHHIANHINESQNSQAVGALIGGVAMTLLLGDAAAHSGQAISDGMRIGAAAGVLTFSRKQEMEADYLAAYIVARAGFNLDTARAMLVKLGRLGGRTTSTVLDTHPAGPERVAAWDLAANEIRAGSPMPRKR